MSYNSKLTAVHKGLTPIYADQDRINFGPQLRSDIRIFTGETDVDGNNIYFNFNKVYDSSDPYHPELAGTVWVISDIDGWYTTPDLELPNIERGYADGSFDVDGRFVARDIELSGSIIITESDRATIGRLNYLARQHLINLFNLVRRGAWFIVDEDALIPVEYEDYSDDFIHEDDTYLNHKRAAYVRVTSRPEIVTTDSRGRIEFSIGLRANDPIKYEWVDSTSGVPTDAFGANGYNTTSVVALAPSTDFRTFSSTAVQWEVAQSSSSDDSNVTSYSTTGIDGSDFVEGYQVYSGDTSVATQQTASGIVAVNHGNTPVYCVLRVTGPVYGPAEITNLTTNQTITILASDTEGIPIIDSANSLTIDTRVRSVNLGDAGSSVYYDGSYRRYLEPLLNWIYLQPGDNVFTFTDFGSQGVTPTLEVFWRSGWIG